MTTGTLASEWRVYVEEIREDAHQLLAWSYADVRARLAGATDEYEITGFLADGMEARLRSADTPDRYLYYAVHNEKPTSASGESGKRRPKLDIQIQRTGLLSRPEFTFEAKRMRDEPGADAAATMRQYLGPDGMGRFCSGRYVPGSPEVAMLGCVQAHDEQFWGERIAAALARDAQNGGAAFSVAEPLVAAAIVSALPHEWLSVHRTESGRQIRIFHVFIDCR